MGFDLSASQWVLILLIVVLIFGTNRLKRLTDGLHSQLRREMGRMPVYSAETTNHREAEFIRDRLPKRFPILVVAVALVTLTAIVWSLAG